MCYYRNANEKKAIRKQTKKVKKRARVNDDKGSSSSEGEGEEERGGPR